MKKQERERSLMSLKTLQNITKESHSSPEGVLQCTYKISLEWFENVKIKFNCRWTLK